MKKSKGILSYVLIIFGAIMASFAVALILLPNDAIDYGTAGAAEPLGLCCCYSSYRPLHRPFRSHQAGDDNNSGSRWNHQGHKR